MEIERVAVDVRFSCRRCQWQWRQRYDVVRWTNYEGDVAEAYFHDGRPVPSPALGRRCPACSSLRVDWVDAAFVPPAAVRRPAVARPVQATVSYDWRAHPHAGRPGLFTQAAHQRQPLTRRFP
jgi:hypothetical protein